MAIQFGENNLQEYLLAFCVGLGVSIILFILKKFFLRKLEALIKKNNFYFGNSAIKIIKLIGLPFYLVISLFLACKFIFLPELASKIISLTSYVVLTYYLVRGSQYFIEYALVKIIKKRSKEENFNRGSYQIIGVIAKIALWTFAGIVFVENLGYDVSGLLAGLGIGGIAVAFALQNILGDVFSYFSIQFDKPFSVGDFIEVGKDSGTVIKIGVKSSRIKTVQGEELIIPNAKLTSGRIANFKGMTERKVIETFTFDPKTEALKLEIISEIFRTTIEKIENVEFERAHFKKYGSFGPEFEVAYLVSNSSYLVYLKAKHKINLELKKRFEKEGIEPAYLKTMAVLEK